MFQCLPDGGDLGNWAARCYSLSALSPEIKFGWMAQAMNDNFKTTPHSGLV